METINVAEAKAHLSELLSRVERGAEIVVTRRGHPIAKITPVKVAKRLVPSLADFRADVPQPDISASEVLEHLRGESR